MADSSSVEITFDDAERALLAHLSDLEQKFYKRPAKGINLMAYQHAWWVRYFDKYRDLDAQFLSTQHERANNLLYDLCLNRDVGIRWLFIIMHNAHSLTGDFIKTYLDDRRWQEYCTECGDTDQAEIRYRYVATQNILGATYPGWVVRDEAYFDQYIYPHARPDIAPGVSPDTPESPEPPGSPTSSASPEDKYAKLVAALKANRWIATEDTPAKSCRTLLECARFIVDLSATHGTLPDPTTIQKLHEDYETVSPERLRKFLGQPSSWLTSARDWLN